MPFMDAVNERVFFGQKCLNTGQTGPNLFTLDHCKNTLQWPAFWIWVVNIRNDYNTVKLANCNMSAIEKQRLIKK